MNALQSEVEGFNGLLKDLRKLVEPKRQRWIFQALAREAIKLNRQRIRTQKNIDGTSFASRSDGTSKKMFKKILRAKQLKIRATGNGVEIEHLNPIAAKHHYGDKSQTKSLTHAQLLAGLKQKNESYQAKRKAGEEPLPGEPCSKKQAKTLKTELGFKKSIRGLQESFTVEQAGYMIKKSRIKAGMHPKRSWMVVTPARDILGLNASDVSRLKSVLAEQIQKHAV